MKAGNERLVSIPSGTSSLEGMLEIPPSALGVVLFAHGSGSSRHSPRNNFVAAILREQGLGTLLVDLLTPAEDEDHERGADGPAPEPYEEPSHLDHCFPFSFTTGGY